MQIVCPSCATSYQIADMAVGAGGRSVRCARCQNVWHVEPAPVASSANQASSAAFRAEPREQVAAPVAPESSEPAGEPTAEADGISGFPPPETVETTAGDDPGEAPMALSEIPIPVTPGLPAEFDGVALSSPEIDNVLPDIESAASRRPRTATRKRKHRARLPLAAAIAALVLVSASLIGFRKEVVRHAPQLASFYSALGMPVNLRGLAFADLKIGNEIHDGVPVLVIEGVIVSTTSKTADVPRLRFALRSASGAEVYSWTAPPAQPSLGAFEMLPFRSRLASPPAEAHDIEVRFFTRHDAVASLR